MSDRISVLLADDHRVVRLGFRRLLEDDPALVVVGEAQDGMQAVALAGTLRPAVVVMDWSMPGVSGLDAARAILEREPSIAVLMVSMHDHAIMVRQAFEAGVRGFLVKNAIAVDLADAVRRVARGETVLDATLEAATQDASTARRLSARQLEVLELICQGRSSAEVAEALAISINTVNVHRTQIMKAFGTSNVAALVTYALQHRLVPSRTA